MRFGLSILMTFLMVVIPAVSVQAEPEIAVRGEGYLGYANREAGTLEDDGLQGGGSGSISIVSGNLYLQGDIFGDSIDIDFIEPEMIGGGVHVGWRDADRGSLGAVGTVNHVEVGSRSSDRFRIGAEAQAFIDRVTVGVNVGFFDTDASSNANFNESLYILAGADYYPTDRARVHIRGGALGVEDDDALGLIGAGGEVLLTDVVGGFVRWEASVFDGGSSFDIDTHSIVAGVTLYFGSDSPSLIAYDRGHFNRSCEGILLLGRNC